MRMTSTLRESHHKFPAKSSTLPVQTDEVPQLPPHCDVWQKPDGTVQIALRLENGAAGYVTIRPHDLPQYLTVRETAMRLRVSESKTAKLAGAATGTKSGTVRLPNAGKPL